MELNAENIGKVSSVLVPRVCDRVFALDDQAHEIAHFLVAAKRRRRMCCFGLGAPSGMGSCKMVVSSSYANEEEVHASLLGIALHAEVSVPEAKETLDVHQWTTCWPDPCDHSFCWMGSAAAGLEKLFAKGLLPPEKAWAKAVVAYEEINGRA